MNSIVAKLHTASELPLAALDAMRHLLLLGLRIYVGWVFLKSGLTKIDDWGSTIALFTEEYHVPFLPPAFAAVAGAAGELVLSPLLIAGLAGRFAALGLFAVNAVAVISYPALFQFECPAALQSHYFWGTMLLVIAFSGPGRLSVDAWIASWLRRAAG